MEIDKRAVLITVSLSSFLTPFSGSSFNIALPSIAATYALDAISMSWASLAYLLASAIVPELYPSLLKSIGGTFAVFFALCMLGVVASYLGSNAVISNRKGGE